MSINNSSHASPSAGLSKTYDSLNSAADDFSPVYSFTGLVTGDTSADLSFSDANYNAADVASANTLTVTGLSINNITGSQNSYPTDYVLASTTATVDASITEADLTITANDAFKFLIGTDPSGFAGVHYSGFVAGEDLSVLSGSVPFLEMLGRLRTPTPSPLMSGCNCCKLRHSNSCKWSFYDYSCK